MKTRIQSKEDEMNRIVCLTVCLMVLGFDAGRAEDAGPARTISVTGTIERQVAPDYISWQIKLTDIDKKLLRAKSASDDNVKSVVSLQKKLKVAEGDLETGPVRIQRVYERLARGERGEFKHFSVDRSVTIHQRELNRFDEFFNALVASADMDMDFVYRSSKLPEVRAEMRLEAMKIAKKKAADMAAAVGASLGRVLIIDEHKPRNRYLPMLSNAMTPGGLFDNMSSNIFVPSTIREVVNVYVTFELE